MKKMQKEKTSKEKKGINITKTHKVIFCIVLVVLVLIFFKVNRNFTNDIEVENTISMINEQYEFESEFEIDGYTIDNPNVILNPYGISPLTAIILFETEEELPVTITVEGKDENSTYINTFESTKKHYLPIYGLYAD